MNWKHILLTNEARSRPCLHGHDRASKETKGNTAGLVLRYYLLFAFFLSALCLSCINKKAAESENTPVIENTEELEISTTTEKVYVVPIEGLNLRSAYGITGTIILLLP